MLRAENGQKPPFMETNIGRECASFARIISSIEDPMVIQKILAHWPPWTGHTYIVVAGLEAAGNVWAARISFQVHPPGKAGVVDAGSRRRIDERLHPDERANARSNTCLVPAVIAGVVRDHWVACQHVVSVLDHRLPLCRRRQPPLPRRRTVR